MIRAIISNLKGLQFKQEQENEYQNSISRSRAEELYKGGFFAAIVQVMFLIPDYYMLHDVFRLALIIRLGVVFPLIAAVMIFLRTYPSYKWMERVESTVILLSNVALLFLVASSKEEISIIYHPGLCLVLIFSNLIVKLPFRHAVMVCGLTFLLYLVGIPFYPANSVPVLTFNVVLLLSTILFSLYANYSMEKEVRKNYILVSREKQRSRILNEENQELHSISSRDPLTQISNRRGMDLFIRKTLNTQKGQITGVIMIDIDFFKKYNDTYGHQKGDECLLSVAQALASAVREERDLIARYGGEEFIMILPGVHEEMFEVIARRVLDGVAALKVPHKSSEISSYLTISCGLALGPLVNEEDGVDLIARADKALYKAKTEGRNRFCF